MKFNLSEIKLSRKDVKRGLKFPSEMNEKLAELYGVMLGDGCLSSYFSNYAQKGIFCTLVTGHTHDEPYYSQVLRPILIIEFGVKGCIRFRKDCQVVRFETTHKNVFNFIKLLGFPIGKKDYLEIPTSIISNNNFSIACVRGIFDTDGSIYSRYSKKYHNHAKFYHYMVVQFKMKSYDLIKQIKNILDTNNIKTTKIGTIKKLYFVVRVTDQESIHIFMKLIKPNNEYHVKRYSNFTNKGKNEPREIRTPDPLISLSC